MGNSPLKKLRIAVHRYLIRFGIDVRKRRIDRKILEQTIFPEILKSTETQHILFVGCAWYTLHYPRIFQSHEFYTMELSHEESKYGAPKHIIDSCENIDEHFEPSSLDVVILNGVYGFGLNHLPAIEKTLSAIHSCLKHGGLFVFGWNDLPSATPYAIEQLTGLNAFCPYVFPVLNTAIHESDEKNRHRFHFYRKGIA